LSIKRKRNDLIKGRKGGAGDNRITFLLVENGGGN